MAHNALLNDLDMMEEGSFILVPLHRPDSSEKQNRSRTIKRLML
jgi:hypothetical protein